MVPALETAGRRVRPLIRALAGTPVNAVLSLMFGAAIAWAGIRVWRWAVADAAFGTTPESCRAVEGACWSVVADMWPHVHAAGELHGAGDVALGDHVVRDWAERHDHDGSD